MIDNALRAASSRMGTTAIMLTLALSLSACATKAPLPTVNGEQSSNAQAIAALQLVNETGMNCWFRSKDAGFKTLRLIPELDTLYGRPRLLLLKRNSPQSLPVMVIEAHGNPTTIETYGPLAQTKLGNRIHADIQRWSRESQACAT